MGFLGNTKANRWRYNAASRRKPLPEARAERRQLPSVSCSPQVLWLVQGLVPPLSLTRIRKLLFPTFPAK